MILALKMADARYDGYEEGFDKGFSKGREDGLQAGLQQGIAQGLQQGTHQKAVETAKSMLSLGLPLDQIQLCTSLPLEKVLELAQTK